MKNVKKEILGEVEHHVLLAVVHLEGAAYSASIAQTLEHRTGRRVSPSSVYIALRRLERARLVRSSFAEAESGRGPRTRRYFSVTEAGRALLRDAHARYMRMAGGLDFLAEGV